MDGCQCWIRSKNCSRQCSLRTNGEIESKKDFEVAVQRKGEERADAGGANLKKKLAANYYIGAT